LLHQKYNNVQQSVLNRMMTMAHSPQAHLSLDPMIFNSHISGFEPIFEQHVTDAAFLWLLRSQVIGTSVAYTQFDINELDQRITGHLDVLIAAGESGWNICLQQLEIKEPGEAFVAGVIALQSRDTEKIKTVCDIVLTNKNIHYGLVSAFGWLNKSTAKFWINYFLNNNTIRYEQQNYYYLGLAACSIRREDPQEFLTKILANPDTYQHKELYARALRLIGELSRTDLIPFLDQAINSTDMEIYFWANWSAVLMGNIDSLQNLKSCIFENNKYNEQAMQLVFNALPSKEAREWINQLSSDSSKQMTAIKASAILGEPDAIPWLIEQMKQKEFSRQAALSFSLITGVDLEKHNLHKKIALKLIENTDGSIADDAEHKDNELPWPNLHKIQAYWDKHAKTFESGCRYFMGKPVDFESLKQVMHSGNQLQRSHIVIKLNMLEFNSKLLNFARPLVTV